MDGSHFFPQQPPPLNLPTKSRTSTVPATRGASIISRRRHRSSSSSSSSSSSLRTAVWRGWGVWGGLSDSALSCCCDLGVFLTNSTEKVYKSRHSGVSDKCVSVCVDFCDEPLGVQNLNLECRFCRRAGSAGGATHIHGCHTLSLCVQLQEEVASQPQVAARFRP